MTRLYRLLARAQMHGEVRQPGYVFTLAEGERGPHKTAVASNAGGMAWRASTLPDGGSFFDLPDSAFERVVDLNLMGTVLPTQVFGAAMAARELEDCSASIVNISSMAAERAITRVAGYSAAKAGVNILTRWLASAESGQPVNQHCSAKSTVKSCQSFLRRNVSQRRLSLQ